MVELHGSVGGAVMHNETHTLFTSLNRTHGVYYSEPNIEFSDGTVIEFAWVRRRDAPPCEGGTHA